MWSILIPVNAENEDVLLGELWERGTLGIVEEPTGWRAFFEETIDPKDILPLVQAPSYAVRQEVPATTQSFAQKDWDPIFIGERFFVAPPWVIDTGPATRIRLEVDADTAFGTGRHETTQICIEALEQLLRPEQVILDVGCGSGILSAAARLLGAQKIFSCDIHEDAIATARRHVNTPTFLGSADAIAPCSVDLVLANISALVLDTLAADLKRVTKPGGCLIVSGFVHEQVPKLYRPYQVIERDDWLCWICQPESISGALAQDARDGLTHKAEWWL